MNVEYTLTSPAAKRRAIDELRNAGFDATTGPIRLAYPFTILVRGLFDEVAAWRIVQRIDPCSGRVVAPSPAPVGLSR